MPTAFITGGAGFIGSVTALTFLEQHWDVTIYDNLFRGHRAAVPVGAKFVDGDIRNRSRLQAALAHARPDCVLHFAALAYVGESFNQPATYFDINIGGTATLLAAMQETAVNRLVFSSSCTVYGEPLKLPISEKEPVKPALSPYGQSKQTCEQMVDWLARSRDFSYASLRYFNAAGAWHQWGEEHHPETHLIPLVIDAALGRRDSLQVFGTDYPTPDGTCIRDYIHIRDLATAHVAAARRLIADTKLNKAPDTNPAVTLRELGETGGSFTVNLGVGRGYSVHEVIRTVEKVSGCPVPVIAAPRRDGDAPELVAANERARGLLGWQPEYSDLETIVTHAVEWRRKCPKGYSS